MSPPWCAIIALAGECAFRRSMHAVVREPDLQRRYQDCSGDYLRCVGATRLQSPPRNHGGLTPAALVHVRLCIAKIAISSASDPHASRSGGRKPAVRSGGALATAFVGALSAVAFGVPLSSLQLRFRTSSQTDTVRRIQERRASARRGLGIASATAYAHLFGPCRRAEDTRAAGVSSPWCAIIALAGECAFRR